MSNIQTTLIYAALLFIILLQAYILFAFLYIKKQKENEYYTDYLHNNVILRVYKPEFEYQAIGKISRDRLLDGGNLTQCYKWALIQK